MAQPQSWTIERSYFDAFGRRHEVSPEDVDRIADFLSCSKEGMGQGAVLVARGNEPHPDNGNAGYPLLVAPDKAYQPDFAIAGRRLWLLAVQLYAVRSRRNWGHGDFTDLRHLLELAAAVGGAGVGVNPLHALPPGQASPYSPSSRLFLNPLYIDLDAVPEFPGGPASALRDEIDELRKAELVDYTRVAAVKAIALRHAHRMFRNEADGARRQAFARFRTERGEPLERYAAFETLRERHGSPWWQWPKEWHNPTPAKLADLQSASEDLEFHAFVQWLADDQLHACRDRARELNLPVGLYLDLAVGVAPDGADAWVGQGALAPGLVIGAPPDAWNPAGQNWGIASFHPQVLIETDFAMFRQTLRAVMRHAGAIRIDHALGLNRVFLIPRGLDARHGTYVRLPFEAMLAVVAQESVATRCLVIGEDLGTVPEGVSETLRDWGVWSYRVALFERTHDGSFRDPHDYPADALVTFTTHDLPTFAGWMGEHDVAVKRAIGIDPGDAAQDRARAVEALREALQRHGIVMQHEDMTFTDASRFIARTPCRLLAVPIEDVLGVMNQINIPGTFTEYQNWMRRLPVDLEDLRGHENIQRLAAGLAAEGRATGNA
jgi:4-alpha-glucanotransferase